MTISYHGIRELLLRREFNKKQYFFRAAFFMLRSRVQNNFSANIWGAEYHLLANRQKLGIDGYLYVLRDDYEPEIRECLLKYFKNGWLFIDIGANSGYWSRFIARRFDQSQIIAFEPSQSTFDRLCKNMTQYSERAQTKNAAVSDTEQLSYLFNESDPGSNHLTSAHSGKAEQVAVVTLDNELKRDVILSQYAGKCVIKIDVEGFELHVLRGASEFLIECRPIIVLELVERHLTRANSTKSDVFSFFAEVGYSIYSLGNNSESTDYQTVTTTNGLSHSDGNFVAIPD